MAAVNSVIVVTSSPAYLELIQEFLSADGTEVRPACCVLEGLLHQTQTSDSVILYDTDVREHWAEALEIFRCMRRSARVVLLSRLADDRMWMDVLDAGGYDLLMKPFRPMEIRSIVRSALQRSMKAVAY